MRKSTWIAGVALAGALTVGGAGLAVAASEDGAGTPESPSLTHEERHAERQAELADRLAEELGLSVDEVTTALETIREEQDAERRTEMLERLDAAVESGELTQDRADEIRERIESGDGIRFGFGLGHRGHGPGGPGAFGGFGPDGEAPEGDGSSTGTPDATPSNALTS